MADARQQSWIIDLVAVEVKDGKDCAVANRIEEFTNVPRSRQRTRFSLSVTDHRGDNEIGIVERGTAGMGKYIPEFASFMYRARRFGRAMTANAAWKRELLKEFTQSGLVFGFVGVDLGISTFEVNRSQNARSPMSWSSQEDHVQV